MSSRDAALDANWGTTCTPLALLATDGKIRDARKALGTKTGNKVVSQANDLSAPTTDLLADNEPAQPNIPKTSPRQGHPRVGRRED